MTLYGYSTGDRLEDRNTYFYSKFHGTEFLSAWRAARNDVLAQLPPSCGPVVSAPLKAEPLDTQALLRIWYARVLAEESPSPEGRDFLDRMVRRFEVTKRVHRQYTPEFKPVDASDYRTLAPYVRFAELLEAVYAKTGFLGYLSTILKVVDTLCSRRESLSSSDAAHLAWLIDREKTHVYDVAARAGLTL